MSKMRRCVEKTKAVVSAGSECFAVHSEMAMVMKVVIGAEKNTRSTVFQFQAGVNSARAIPTRKPQ